MGLISSQVVLTPTAEQRRFARVVQGGTWLALATLAVGFACYVGGFVRPLVPIDHLPAYWGFPAAEWLAKARVPPGWGWLRFVVYGDFLNFVGIVMLASLAVVGYLAILPIFIRKRDVAYSLIVLAEIAILLLAASGVVSVGT